MVNIICHVCSCYDVFAFVNGICREKETLSLKLNELNAELLAVTVQRDELEKSSLDTRLQAWKCLV